MVDKCLSPRNRNRTWLIKYYFFFNKRGVILKELGEYLKSVREENGVGIEEASDDLKISVQILNNIENGNTRAFRDMLELKEIVKLYSKYLGLDSEKVIDEFNDFMFEHTSKISLSDILEAEKEVSTKEKKVVHSPYTIPSRPQINVKYLKFIIIGFLVVVFLFIVIILLKNMLLPDDKVSSELKSKIEVNLYEYA